MARISKKNVKELNMNHPLDAVRMKAGERDLAKAHMETAERVADLACGLVSALQFLVAGLGSGIAAAAHRMKPASAKTRASLMWE